VGGGGVISSPGPGPGASAFIEVLSDGPRVVATSYWSSPHAQSGYVWISVNAGAVRVLVPPAAERRPLAELPPAGTPCLYVQDGRSGARRIVYLDDPASLWVLEVGAAQADRTLPPGEHGRKVRLLWYGQDGERGVRLLRDEERRNRCPVSSSRQNVPLVRPTGAWHNGMGVSGWRSCWTCCGR
jgi:hypothetical protein